MRHVAFVLRLLAVFLSVGPAAGPCNDARADTDDPVQAFIDELGDRAIAGEFLLTDASKAFDVTVSVQVCGENLCLGRASIELRLKGDSAPFQTIEVDRLHLELGEDHRPTVNVVELYGSNNGGLIFGDFNFDGHVDFALRNGSDGNYGGPSYDVMVYSPSSRSFVANAGLTELASHNLGFFKVDPEKRQIETFSKSGCCRHWTRRYRVEANEPVPVYVETDDVNGDTRTLTIEELIDGEWRKTVTTTAVDEGS